MVADPKSTPTQVRTVTAPADARLDINAAADVVGVGRWVVERFIRDGWFPSVKPKSPLDLSARTVRLPLAEVMTAKQRYGDEQAVKARKRAAKQAALAQRADRREATQAATRATDAGAGDAVPRSADIAAQLDDIAAQGVSAVQRFCLIDAQLDDLAGELQALGRMVATILERLARHDDATPPAEPIAGSPSTPTGGAPRAQPSLIVPPPRSKANGRGA